MFMPRITSDFIVVTLLVASFFCAPAPSWAQTSTDDKAAAEAAAQQARETAEARIENQMVQMSDLAEALVKNIGQLHYLRQLCFGDKDQYWRDFAGRMLQLETGNDVERREYLTRAFNAGYFLEQERFKTCSSDVPVDAAALAENGRRLASMLGDPYRDF
jgi:uncharacterized protein (TIGR02301 family)